ncbi:MAG: hypothetical protein ACE5IW_03295 [bacterium]
MAKIEQLKKKYEGQWLAIEVTKEKNGEATEGELILHTANREELWKKVPPSKDKIIYITYAGPPLEEGYAAAF